MSNGNSQKDEIFVIETKSTLVGASANWKVELPEEMMLPYQVYANTLVAAVVAKLGEYALELQNDPDAMKTGFQKVTRAIADI